MVIFFADEPSTGDLAYLRSATRGHLGPHPATQPTFETGPSDLFAAHEIPQELGDFGILIHAGWSRNAALASGSTVILGGLLVYGLAGHAEVTVFSPLHRWLQVHEIELQQAGQAESLASMHRVNSGFVGRVDAKGAL